MLQTFEVVRKGYEALYKDTCTISEYKKVLNDDKSTSLVKTVVCENQPCRLSVSSKSHDTDTSSASEQSQTITLFMSPDITVGSGSDIVVTHEGRETAFKNSGYPAVYPTHQEIVLELGKEHA